MKLVIPMPKKGNVSVQQLLKADHLIKALAQGKISGRYKWARKFTATRNCHRYMIPHRPGLPDRAAAGIAELDKRRTIQFTQCENSQSRRPATGTTSNILRNGELRPYQVIRNDK